MNTNAQSDIDDGSGALIKLVCKYTDPQYPSFKVIIERENGRAMFGILHGKAILKKKKPIEFELDKKTGKVKQKSSLFTKKERVYELSGRGSDFIFSTSINMKNGKLLHWVTDNTGSEQGKPGSCKRYN